MNETITRTEFDSAAERVLSRPEYAHLKSGIQDMIEKVKETIGEWLRRLLEGAFSSLSHASTVPKSLATVFLIIGLLIFLAIVVFITVKASRTFSRKAAVKEILGERIEAGTTSAGLREKAAGHMKNGEIRMAIRYEYIALLLLLHENNLIYLDETKTNDEIAGYLEKDEIIPMSVFRNLVRTFNASWYGHKSMQSTNCEKWNSDMNLIWGRVIEIDEKSR